MKTASATIEGFEAMRMIRRGHCLTCKPHVKDEVRFVNKLFDVYSSAA
jgi:IS6 family transposase